MSGEELARMIHTWPDVLTVAEVVSNPFLQVTDQWDLRGWKAVEVPEGVKFEHSSADGQVTERILLTEPDEVVGQPGASISPTIIHESVAAHR